MLEMFIFFRKFHGNISRISSNFFKIPLLLISYLFKFLTERSPSVCFWIGELWCWMNTIVINFISFQVSYWEITLGMFLDRGTLAMSWTNSKSVGGIYALGTDVGRVAVLDFCNFIFLVEIDFRDLFLVLRTPFGNQLLLLVQFLGSSNYWWFN